PRSVAAVDPPVAYYAVEIRNPTTQPIPVSTYAFADLRGDTSHDVITEYREDERALIAWNEADPDLVRAFSCTTEPAGHEVTLDYGRAVSHAPLGPLSGATGRFSDPLGVLHVRSVIAPGDAARFA